ESVIRSSSSGIVVLDGKDCVHSANPAFAQLVRRDEAELLTRDFSEILPGVKLGNAPVGDEEKTFETSCTGPDAPGRDLRVSSSRLQGAPDRRVVPVDDGTDR